MVPSWTIQSSPTPLHGSASKEAFPAHPVQSYTCFNVTKYQVWSAWVHSLKTESWTRLVLKKHLSHYLSTNNQEVLNWWHFVQNHHISASSMNHALFVTWRWHFKSRDQMNMIQKPFSCFPFPIFRALRKKYLCFYMSSKCLVLVRNLQNPDDATWFIQWETSKILVA